MACYRMNFYLFQDDVRLISNLSDRAWFCRELALLFKCIRQHVSYKRFLYILLCQKVKTIE